MQRFDRLALAALLAALALWSVAPDWMATGIMMLLAGALHSVRLARWQFHQTLAEPLVWVLHLAFAFIPLGTLTLGFGVTSGSADIGVAGLHIWTIGALGLMPMAVMTRATLGHTGGALHAGPMTVALYLCVLAALIFRPAAWFAADPRLMIIASAACWSIAFPGVRHGLRAAFAAPPRMISGFAQKSFQGGAILDPDQRAGHGNSVL